jgi:PleD family two-component response regulator
LPIADCHRNPQSTLANPQFNRQSAIGNRQSLMSHILVVEDDADIAELIGHFLKRPDTGSTGSRQKRRAASASKVPVDLVILDLMLPGMDGLILLSGHARRPDAGVDPHHYADGEG